MIVTDEISGYIDDIVSTVKDNILVALENADKEDDVIMHWRELRALAFVESEIQAEIFNQEKVRDHE